MRNNITGNSTYELPFGERKRFAHKGVSAKILGNIRLSGKHHIPHRNTVATVVLGQLTAINSGASLSTRPNILGRLQSKSIFQRGQISVSESSMLSCFAAPGKQFLPQA